VDDGIEISGDKGQSLQPYSMGLSGQPAVINGKHLEAAYYKLKEIIMKSYTHREMRTEIRSISGYYMYLVVPEKVNFFKKYKQTLFQIPLGSYADRLIRLNDDF